MGIVTIHQPEYLPWIGFFDRILRSDLFIILDDVSYQKNEFINRNKIKTAKGWQWLTVPVLGRSPNQKICEVLIDNKSDWGKDQWKSLCCNYSKAPYFKKYSNFFEDVFRRKWDLIAELDVYLITNILGMLGAKTKIEEASSLKVAGEKTARLINICKKAGADTYLAGPGGKGYMDLEKFEKEKINVVFQAFSHPEYPQRFARGNFLPDMSVIDLIFNCGEKSREIILRQN